KLTLFTLVTARPEFRPPWLTKDSVLELAPLTNEHVAKLASVTTETLSRQAIDRIVQRADGIPLYAEEMAQVPAASESAIPTTLHYLPLARLESVPHARRVLQLAATLGRKFQIGPLLKISGLTEDELDPLLKQLIEARLVTPVGSLGNTLQ